MGLPGFQNCVDTSVTLFFNVSIVFHTCHHFVSGVYFMYLPHTQHTEHKLLLWETSHISHAVFEFPYKRMICNVEELAVMLLSYIVVHN